MINLNVNRIQGIRDKTIRGNALNPFKAEVLVIGGGGAGGALAFPAGGGAGGFISASWTVPAETTFDVTIGNGAIGQSAQISQDGEDTTIVLSSTLETVFNAFGGGGTGNDGGSGGGEASGGGPGGTPIPCVIPSSATLVISPTGNSGSGGSGVPAGGGAGGGILGDAVARTGGPGIGIGNTFVNGLVTGVTTFAYGGGGRLASSDANGASAPSGSGGGGSAGGGTIGNVGGSGGSGLFAIKYEGLPKASGGTITQSGGYTTHVFTGSGQFTVVGRTNNNP